jgi:hypothetical protein
MTLIKLGDYSRVQFNMSDVKEVVVFASPADLKAPRKARRTRKSGGSGEPAHITLDVPTETVYSSPAVAPLAPTPVPLPAVVVGVPAASLATMSVVGGSVPAPIFASTVATDAPGKVHMRAKKNLAILPQSGGPAPGAGRLPTIVPHKKRTGSAPLVKTLKKPRLIIPAPIAIKSDNKGGKRRFTERRISIVMQPASTTRRNRRRIKDKIASMPIASVKRILTGAGVLKETSVAPPEEMLRSMLRDYMLLHTAD